MAKWLDRLTGADKVLAAASEVTRALDVLTEQKAATTFDHATVFGQGLPMSLLNSKGVDDAYSRSWVAYSCIKRIATDAAGVPMHVLRDPTDPDSVVPPTHPLAALIARPSPFFSQAELVQWMFTWLPLRGEFFIRFDDPRNPREMIFWTDPRWWKEQLVDERPARWTYQLGASHYSGSVAEVLQSRLVNPANPWRGLPPLQSAKYAYSIDTTADVLQSDVIDRGGERTVIWEFPSDITDEQREQAKSQLRGRRRNDGTVSQDVVVPRGAKLMDSKFMDSDLAILESQKMQPDKICAVYGLSKSLLGIEDIDKYATFQGRLKVYFTQTLIPMMRGVESSFDAFFGRYYGSQWQGFVRFDMRAVESLFDDTTERFTAANLAHAGGLPWTECNRLFRLGLDIEGIPGADVVLVSSALAPIDKLIEEWDSPPEPAPTVAPTAPPVPAPEPPEKAAPAPVHKGLTQAEIIKRARDPRQAIQRYQRLTRAEAGMRREWKAAVGKASLAARTGVKPGDGPQQVREAVASAFNGLDTKMQAIAEQYQGKGATEGAQAITELVHGKMTDSELSTWKARAPWRPQVADHIRKRANLIKGMADDLFADVVEHAVQAVTEGAESHEVQSVIAQRMASAPGGANRAVTIARTEVGTAYQVARDAEMRAQGYSKHMWLTAGDDLVRDDDPFDHAKCNEEVRVIGEQFSCGLAYPMEPGGEAGNVINCRCETVPIVAGME